MPSLFRSQWAPHQPGRTIRTIAAFALSAALLWLAVRSVKTVELVAVLRSSSPSWIATSLALYWLELGLRSVRWRRLLAPVGALSMGQVSLCLIIGYAANNTLPARLGEVVRADLIGRRYGLSRFSAMATIVVERLLDVFAVVACASAGLLTMASEKARFELSGTRSNIIDGVIIAATIAIVLVGALYVAINKFHSSPSVRWPKLRLALSAIEVGLRSMKRPRLLPVLIALSVLIWVCNGFSMWAMLAAVGIHASTASIVLLLGIAGIAAAMPAAPANIGTLQFAFVLALGASGYSSSAAFAAATLVQVVLYGSVTLVGAILYGSGSLFPGRRKAHGPE